MTAALIWSSVAVDDERALIYGPRIGRLYIVTHAQARDRHLQAVLGLPPAAFRDTIADPADAIAHDLGSLKTRVPPAVPMRLRAAYRVLHRSRSVVPFAAAVALIRRAAAAGRRTRAQQAPAPSVSDIGRVLHAIEQSVGLADCYPRALVTALLALRHGLDCRLAVGVLAPTRKMHAWCSIDGQLPYEALPEHYMYRPLLVVSLRP